jgi:putative aminopeptidase FrvX
MMYKMNAEEISMKAMIQKLTEAYGPSGFETQVRGVIKDLIKPLEGCVDSMGNLIIRIGAKKKNGSKIMIAAHMDEIGVMISHIDDNGFARFSPIGGVYVRNCIGGRVRFADGTIGVIGIEKLESADKLPGIDKLYIDTGVANRKDSPVKIGDTACFERPFTDLGSRLICKAMDDRIGCAVIVEAMKQIHNTPHELIFVFSTQEEVGLRGATAAAYSVDPEIGISVDVTLVGDTPKGTRMAVSLGKGPAIKIRDSGMISDPRLVNAMKTAAQKALIPCQLEVLEGGTTDARVMQISRAGMPAACISIPCRYVHSSSEMVDYNDVENTVKLLVALLSKPIVI